MGVIRLKIFIYYNNTLCMLLERQRPETGVHSSQYVIPNRAQAGTKQYT